MSSQITPGKVKKKKKVLGLFGRKKKGSAGTDETAPVGATAEEAVQYDSEEYETDSEDDNKLAIPGQHLYSNKDKDIEMANEGTSRGRGLLRGGSVRGDASRSRSRSSSVSRAFRRLVGGGGPKNGGPPPPHPQHSSRRLQDTGDEASRSQSRRSGGKKTKSSKADDASRENRPPIPRTIEAYQGPNEDIRETPRAKNKKKKVKDESSVGGSLTGIEISIQDDASNGRLSSIADRSKKKNKKKKDRDSINDDESNSKGSLPPASPRKRTTTKKKNNSFDGSSMGDSQPSSITKKKSRRKREQEGRRSRADFDVVNRAMTIKNQRASVQADLKTTLERRESRRLLMEDDRLEAPAPSSQRNIGAWENEEYLISPKPSKRRSFDDSFGDSEPMQGRPSTKSMDSEMSSLRKSYETFSSEFCPSPTPAKEEDSGSGASGSGALAGLSHEIEKQKKQNSNLEKSLADALKKIEALSEDLLIQQTEAAKSRNELHDVRREMSSVSEQNARLHKSLDAVERELSTKEDKIDALEQVVEQQLDRVEFLEDKLQETEEELFKMEDELKEMEAKTVVPNPEPARGRLERVNSIRMGRMERLESKRELLRGDSVRDLVNNSMDKSTHNRRASELSSRERKLEERERQVEVNRERDEAREQRLQEWEDRLEEMEKKSREKSAAVVPEVSDEKALELEKRELRLAAEWEELDRERERIQKKAQLQTVPNLMEDEKDQLISDLRLECEDLVAEKEELIRRHEEEERQREEDLNIIQEDINARLAALDKENQALRDQLEEVEERAALVDDYKNRIATLETEIGILKKASAAAEGQEDMLRQLQDEVSEQLAELDQENKKLSERLAREQATFREQIKEKEATIEELEEMMEELEKGQESTEKEADKKLSQELADALEAVDEKQNEIKELQKKLGRITEEFEERNAQELLAKDAKLRQLEDELVATRAVIEAKTSDQLSSQMKAEIKSLKEIIRELNKRIKSEQHIAKTVTKQKEDTTKALQREIDRLQREVERRQKHEKLLSDSKEKGTAEADLKQHIEDLEEEVEHWKAVNCELEDEVTHWKSEANELKAKLEEQEDPDGDDNGSLGSFTSHISKQSRQSLHQSRHSIANDHMNKSHHSFSSLSKEDLFFVSGGGTANGSGDGEQSSRAVRTVTDLWSKMTTRQPPAPASGPYQMNLYG